MNQIDNQALRGPWVWRFLCFMGPTVWISDMGPLGSDKCRQTQGSDWILIYYATHGSDNRTSDPWVMMKLQTLQCIVRPLGFVPSEASLGTKFA